jgi:hypothetical protein
VQENSDSEKLHLKKKSSDQHQQHDQRKKEKRKKKKEKNKMRILTIPIMGKKSIFLVKRGCQ